MTWGYYRTVCILISISGMTWGYYRNVFVLISISDITWGYYRNVFVFMSFSGMTWGYYEVVVIGMAENGNYGECRTQLFIRCMLHSYIKIILVLYCTFIQDVMVTMLHLLYLFILPLLMHSFFKIFFFMKYELMKCIVIFILV